MKIKKWVPDNITYNKIQKLKKFVEFVASTEYTTLKFKKEAKEIIQLIESIDKPYVEKYWDISLDLLDEEILNNNLEGFHWKEWSVSFEFNTLTVVAKTHNTDDNLFRESDFLYYFTVNFEKDFKGVRVSEERATMNDFLNDVTSFKKYYTDSMNTVNAEINLNYLEK